MTFCLRYPGIVLLTLALALLAPLSAKDVRHPATGSPAYSFTIPDDWATQDGGDGNLLIMDPKRSTIVVILVVPSTEPLDKIASDAIEVSKATPPSRKEPATISGCAGFTWFSTVQNPNKATLTLEMTIVKIDEKTVASASLLIVPGVSPEAEATARRVRNGLALVKEAPIN
jgi:hypothetical protein